MGNGRSRGGNDAVGLFCAYLITLVVGYAAVGKLMAPNPKKLIFEDMHLDYLIACAELGLIFVLLPFHRSKLLWGVVAVMFGGFLGYTSYWTFSRGAPCGCFGELWDPPLGVTVGLDLVFVILALINAKRFGMKKGLLRVCMIGALLAGGVGAYYAYSNSPEAVVLPDEPDGPELRHVQDQLWYSDLLSEQRSLQENGEIIATLVFVYEVGCSTCEMYKPDMEAYRELFDAEQDFTMRIVMISTEEAEAEAGIEVWAWEPAPIVFVARDGAVDGDVFWSSGEDTPLDIVDQVYEWANDGVAMPYPPAY